VRLLDEACRGGVRVAIASTSASVNTNALLSRHLGAAATRIFDAIACAEHVRHKKPAPDIYLHAIAMLGEGAAACIAFEDSANGVHAAKAAGLFTVATPSPWTLSDDLSEADLELPHLGDPDRVLPSGTGTLVGAPWLGLAELRRLHASRGATADGGP
jgi:beta-phosphoglucomutase-like phosphatase (HAD superfamily)